MEITKAYFMLPVRDMERAVSFYRDAVKLTVEFSSPFWSELRWREATIALHGGARLVAVVDPEGNAFTLGQDVS